MIAPSFGDIHYQNAIKNGLLPAIVSEADAAELAGQIAAEPAQDVTVDLDAQTIVCGARRYAFSIDPVSRNQLLNGWDDVDLTDSRRAEIAEFKQKDRQRRPWAAAPTTAPPARA